MEDILRNTNPNLILYETGLKKYIDPETYEFYRSKFVLLFMIEQCNPEITKLKILEFDVKPIKCTSRHLNSHIVESIIDYGDSEMIDLWNYQEPGSVRYFLENTNIFLKNTNNILWLVNNYGLSFFDFEKHDNNKDYFLKKDKKLFLTLIDKINFSKYNQEDKILQFAADIQDIDALKIIINNTKVIKRFKTIYREIFQLAVLNLNKQFINYYFNNYQDPADYDKKILELYLLNFDSLCSYNPNIYYLKSKSPSILKLSPFVEKIYFKLIEIHGKKNVIDFICYDYNVANLSGCLFTSLIRFKCVKVIEDIYNYLGKEEFENILEPSVIEDLLRYGQHIVLKFLLELDDGKIMKKKLQDYYQINPYITASLYNSDDRFFKVLIPYLGKRDDRICYSFLDSSRMSTKTKIRKIKLILKNTEISTDYLVRSLIDESDEKLQEWIIKKIYNNNIPNDSNTIKLLSKIITTNNVNFIQQLFNSLSPDFNYWNFMVVIIFMNIAIKHLDFIIKNIFNKLDNIKNHPVIAEKILNDLSYYNNIYYIEVNTKKHKLEFYDNILGILKQCGLDLNSSKKSILQINNQELLKIGIKHGIRFPDYIRQTLKNYNVYQLFTSPLKPYFKMYRLIRRIEIRKEIKNKRNHKHLFEDTNVCIKSRPPVSDIPVLSKRGGQMFYKDMEEVGSFLEDGDEEFVYPVQITPLKLLEIVKEPILITPKIDGVTKFDIGNLNVRPSFPYSFDSYEIDSEYVKELDLHLVFGIRNKHNYYNCIYEDYKELKDTHPYAKHDHSSLMLNTSDYDSLMKIYMDEFERIINFRNSNTGTIWYPKKFWIIHDTELALEIIEKLQYIQEEIVQNLPDTEMKTFIQNYLIRTDGFIINKLCNKKEYYKLKPGRDMTIDLRYNGIWTDREGNQYEVDTMNHKSYGVYRCIYEYGGWRAQDYRPEKFNPNPKNVVDIVYDYHKFPWEVKELKKYHTKNYYQEFRNNPKLRNMNSDKSSWLSNFISSNQKVLDIGCGFLLNQLWKNSTLEIDGLDNDIKILERYKSIKGTNKNFYLQDISKPWKLFDDCIKRNTNKKMEIKIYDTILLNLTVHYSFKENCGFLNLMREVNKRSNSQTNLMISFIDKNLLFKNSNIIKFNDSGYMKLLDKENGYYRMKYYYPWRHNFPMEEPILEREDLVSYLESLGWYVKKEYRNKYYYEEEGYRELADSITRLVLIKLNI